MSRLADTTFRNNTNFCLKRSFQQFLNENKTWESMRIFLHSRYCRKICQPVIANTDLSKHIMCKGAWCVCFGDKSTNAEMVVHLFLDYIWSKTDVDKCVPKPMWHMADPNIPVYVRNYSFFTCSSVIFWLIGQLMSVSVNKLTESNQVNYGDFTDHLQ